MSDVGAMNTADWYCQKVQEGGEFRQDASYREIRKVAVDLQVMGDMMKAVFEDGSQMIFPASLLR
ncbi:MAG: hypothetical protein ACI4NO_01750 [Oxalobacter sp.]